jgi:hypothetical protein
MRLASKKRLPEVYSLQRVLAAFLAISRRRLADIPAARAFPPIRPNATAAAFLPSDSGVGRTSLISPVAILCVPSRPSRGRLAWSVEPRWQRIFFQSHPPHRRGSDVTDPPVACPWERSRRIARPSRPPSIRRGAWLSARPAEVAIAVRVVGTRALASARTIRSPPSRVTAV